MNTTLFRPWYETIALICCCLLAWLCIPTVNDTGRVGSPLFDAFAFSSGSCLITTPHGHYSLFLQENKSYIGDENHKPTGRLHPQIADELRRSLHDCRITRIITESDRADHSAYGFDTPAIIIPSGLGPLILGSAVDGNTYARSGNGHTNEIWQLSHNIADILLRDPLLLRDDRLQLPTEPTHISHSYGWEVERDYGRYWMRAHTKQEYYWTQTQSIQTWLTALNDTPDRAFIREPINPAQVTIQITKDKQLITLLDHGDNTRLQRRLIQRREQTAHGEIREFFALPLTKELLHLKAKTFLPQQLCPLPFDEDIKDIYCGNIHLHQQAGQWSVNSRVDTDTTRVHSFLNKLATLPHATNPASRLNTHPQDTLPAYRVDSNDLHWSLHEQSPTLTPFLNTPVWTLLKQQVAPQWTMEQSTALVIAPSNGPPRIYERDALDSWSADPDERAATVDFIEALVAARVQTWHGWLDDHPREWHSTITLSTKQEQLTILLHDSGLIGIRERNLIGMLDAASQADIFGTDEE